MLSFPLLFVPLTFTLTGNSNLFLTSVASFSPTYNILGWPGSVPISLEDRHPESIYFFPLRVWLLFSALKSISLRKHSTGVGKHLTESIYSCRRQDLSSHFPFPDPYLLQGKLCLLMLRSFFMVRIFLPYK